MMKIDSIEGKELMVNRIYSILLNDNNLKGKLNFNESTNQLRITFNKYLHLKYFEGSYESAKDEGIIYLNDNLTHWHITEDKDALELIYWIANGDFIFIENTRRFSFSRLRIMCREKFEKKREKYLSQKSLRIYTGNTIIKHDV